MNADAESFKGWRLVADIGGSNARFAINLSNRDQLEWRTVYSVAKYPSFVDALKEYLSLVSQQAGCQGPPQATCLAVACPADQDPVCFTNSNWSFTRKEVETLLGHKPLVINDFAAIAYSIPDLKSDDWVSIGGGKPHTNQPVVMLGPGTGLGVCTLLPISDGFRVVDGEGGHADFAAIDELEMSILQKLQQRYGRVSIERLLSGDGLLNIYQVLCELESDKRDYTTAQQISQAALAGYDARAIEVLSIFCRVLGSTAGNLALINGAKGGVYLAGGILPQIRSFVENSDLRERFEDKGRFREYLQSIPVRLMIKEDPGLHGALRRLKQKG